MSASVKYVEWRCSHCGNTVSRAKNLGKPAGGFCSKNNQKPHTYKKQREKKSHFQKKNWRTG